MKSEILIAITLLFSFTALKAQNANDYKNYKIQIGKKWYEADAKIDKKELKSIKFMSLQSNLDASKKADIDSCTWAISKKDRSHWTAGSADFIKGKLMYPPKWVEKGNEDLDDYVTGDIFLLQKISVSGNDKTYPTFFRLYFK